MGSIKVAGHFRVDPRTGNKYWVDGYVRKGKAAKAVAKAGRISVPAVPSRSSLKPTTRGHLQVVKKRNSLTGGKKITADTPGWEEVTDRPLGSRKSVPTTARLAMTDEKYDEWFKNTLSRARTAVNNKQRTVDNPALFDKRVGDWTPARKEQQEKVIAAFMARAKSTPRQNKAVLTGGRPGAGKSSSLKDQGIDPSRYFTVDSDSVKEEMIRQGLSPEIEGLTPFESAGLIHQESSDIADVLLERLGLQGTNVVFDGTMAWEPYILQHVDTLKALGYSLSGLFVDVSPETSRRRAIARHRRGVEEFLSSGKGIGGRFVDPTLSQRPHAGRSNFELIRKMFDQWAMYSNDVDGEEPILTDSSSPEVRFSKEQDLFRDVNRYVTLAGTQNYPGRG